jgi:hypothetical protein
VGVLTGAAGAAALPSFINASSALGAATGSVSSATLGIVNGASPGKFLEIVLVGTAIGFLTGEAVGAKVGVGVDTVDFTPILGALGKDLPVTVLVVYESAVNGYFLTAHLTGSDTGLPDWLAALIQLSGVAVPAGLVIAGVAPVQAAPAALNVAPEVP